MTKLGFGHWRPHELRHSAISILSDAGVPHTKIADVVGHDDNRMIDRVYRHRLSPTADGAVGPMDDIFGGTRDD